MAKKVLIISTSLRGKSNSRRMAEEFAKGAEKAGHQVEMISLADYQIGFCTGCLVCQTTQKCVIKDDAVKIADKMKESEIIVFASPIYYYEMSGQMKTLLDRMNPLYGSDYKFTDIYFLTCAAEDEEHVPERAENGLQGWIDCFKRASLKGTVFAGGAINPGEIEAHRALKDVFIMGQLI
ncbi:MAG: flavodoxin family protein [bacterium]|nr:flavodoxin family protein [bacterium]